MSFYLPEFCLVRLQRLLVLWFSLWRSFYFSQDNSSSSWPKNLSRLGTDRSYLFCVLVGRNCVQIQPGFCVHLFYPILLLSGNCCICWCIFCLFQRDDFRVVFSSYCSNYCWSGEYPGKILFHEDFSLATLWMMLVTDINLCNKYAIGSV